MKLTTLKNQIMAFVKDEEGATAIEYALIAALIAIAIVGSLRGAGTSISELFGDVKTTLDGTGAPTK